MSFEIGKGEVVGFVGSNGTGKSTLLKVVAGVLKPTKGSIETYGNICPMIEWAQASIRTSPPGKIFSSTVPSLAIPRRS